MHTSAIYSAAFAVHAPQDSRAQEVPRFVMGPLTQVRGVAHHPVPTAGPFFARPQCNHPVPTIENAGGPRTSAASYTVQGHARFVRQSRQPCFAMVFYWALEVK